MRLGIVLSIGLASLPGIAQTATAPVVQASGPQAVTQLHPMAVPADFNDHAGFTQLFDGKTLAGWDGDPAVWSVVDGAMVGQFHSPEGTKNAQSYIVLQGREPGDFELRLEIKMEGPTADSGIQYRSVHPPPTVPRPGILITDPRYNAVGLQYDFNQVSGIGSIAESAGRGVIAAEGQVIQAETGKLWIVGIAAPVAEVKAATWHMGEWNQVRLIARGHVLTQILNGRVTAVLFDDDAVKFRAKGVIGLQCAGAGSPRISFRNIWLKDLP
jgi:hypothetical protein